MTEPSKLNWPNIYITHPTTHQRTPTIHGNAHTPQKNSSDETDDARQSTRHDKVLQRTRERITL